MILMILISNRLQNDDFAFDLNQFWRITLILIRDHFKNDFTEHWHELTIDTRPTCNHGLSTCIRGVTWAADIVEFCASLISADLGTEERWSRCWVVLRLSIDQRSARGRTRADRRRASLSRTESWTHLKLSSYNDRAFNPAYILTRFRNAPETR